MPKAIAACDDLECVFIIVEESDGNAVPIRQLGLRQRLSVPDVRQGRPGATTVFERAARSS